MAAYFYRSVFFLVLLNLIVKPLWIFGVDRQVQVMVGYKAYGTYFAYFGLTLIFNIIADLGITLYIQRNLAHLQVRGSWFSKAVIYKIFLSAGYIMLVILAAEIMQFNNFSLLLALALLQTILSWIAFCRAVLSAEQLYNQSSFLSILDKLLIILPLGWLLYLSQNQSFITIDSFAWWQVASSSVALVWGLFSLKNRSRQEVSDQMELSYLQIIRQSMPYAIMIFFMFLHSRADGIMLEKLTHEQDGVTGLYAALYRFIDAGTVFSYLISGFFLSYWSKHLSNIHIIQESMNRMFAILMSVALWIGIYFFFFSDSLTEIIYHSSDPHLTQLLKWGFFTFLPCFMVDVFGTVLTANQRIKAMLTFVFFSTLINIGLNLYFIPTYGAEAAMFVAMFTQAFFGICLWVYCKKNWNIEPARAVIIRLAILTIILYISALIVKSLFSNPLLHGVLLFITWVISVLILRLFSFKWFQEIQTN